MVTESPTGYGGIVRADLADLLVGAAASPLATGKTFTAVDRTKYVDGRAAPRGSAGGKTRPAATAAAAAAPPRLDAHAGWGGARAARVHGGDRGVAVVRGEFWLLRVEWRAQLRLCLAVCYGFGETVGVGGSAPAAHPIFPPHYLWGADAVWRGTPHSRLGSRPAPTASQRQPRSGFRPCLIVPVQPTHRLVPLPVLLRLSRGGGVTPLPFPPSARSPVPAHQPRGAPPTECC